MGKCLKVCETCPWLKKNHGRAHPAGWYKTANIRRLWNALRRGEPGVICHASDPDSTEYGGTAVIRPTVERRPCAGALLAVGKHIEDLNEAKDIRTYQGRNRYPLTRRGIGRWVERILLGQLPAVEDRRSEIGFPWDEPDPQGVDRDHAHTDRPAGRRGPSTPG